MQKKTFIEEFTIGFFWFAFAVFLLASSPHIATYFRHFSGSTTDWFQDGFDWVVSWLIALVIDVSEILVSIALMKEQKLRAGLHKTAPYWLFVIFIMSLSWFINWQYNRVFQDNSFHVVDSMNIPFVSGHTIGDVNPVVGGCFVVLMLVYSGMAHKFRSETLEEIEAQNAEMEKKKDAIKRRRDLVNEISGGDNSEKKDALDSAFDLAERAKNRFSKLRKTNDPQKPDLAKNVTETQASENVNIAQNVPAQDEQILQETTSSSEIDLGLNGNIHHEVNYPQTNPVTPEPGSLDFALNANQIYGYEVENHAPDLAEMKQETQASPEVYKDVVFEDLYAETAPAEEPEEEPATEPLERAETSEEQAQTKRRDTGSYKKLNTSAQKAVSSGVKYTKAEEIADLQEVKEALNFTGRGAPLRRLQAVNDAIQRKEIRWYGGGYSHSAVMKWLEGQKESA